MSSASSERYSFIVVANRLPVDLERDSTGKQRWVPSPGGLVSALTPVLSAHEGAWVGWPGVADAEPEPLRSDKGFDLHPVALSQRDFEEFYEGFSNATLWPLYHDLIVTPEYHRHWWETYREVNLRFAEATAALAAEGATVWVQDYQLQLVPGILRHLRPDLTIGLFVHIPFPSPDLFRQLPWREEIVRGMLGSDVIGFHLDRDAANFVHLAKSVGGLAGSHTGQPDELDVSEFPEDDCPDSSSEQDTEHHCYRATVTTATGRTVHIGAFPISLDTSEITAALSTADVPALRATLGEPEVMIVGVDRLDYTKGIEARLDACEELFETGALDPATTVIVQVATPSRERIEHYRRTRARVEHTVGRINGRFGEIGRPVVHYLHHTVDKDELVNLYAAADIMLVTPLKDGMNLVAKEYVCAHPEGHGALVLSEFAGAAAELQEAYLCNPHDVESIKRALLSAVRDLKDDPADTRDRMQAMNRTVMDHDVHYWAESFLSALDTQAGGEQ
ncbi:Trehalose-phosphate synthase [Corynebacterium ciconiae DSM 44920]|uniref:alpha,alpha-trehalose-phosphate synthase (UDP-forming) n=1 Tax=Corynebacterium ciconiae TaxID=227319 RepID=UPI0003803A17|nr:trehalose-6-phosphate synthase [Corynebacterium ciconiae]WKD60489.1 Trehalose-phosphate synthase [Corynebacterium ciconiae DSM 44920]